MTKMKDLDDLLNTDDMNESIIELDVFISELCAHGDDLTKLTDGQKIFFLNQNLEREINNGGFNQFFCNSSGDNAHETILSLQAIGATKTGTLLQKAIDQFPNKTVPAERDERVEIVEQIEETANDVWEKLDEEFFACEDDLDALNIEYIRKNRNFF